MKIYVEQVLLDQGILIYSKFVRFTDSEDEEGSDYEYDFDGVYSNLDNIQNTIIRLYGIKGLIDILRYFSEGKSKVVEFDPIEFEEGSKLKELIEENNQYKEPILPTDDSFDISDAKPPSRVTSSNSLFLASGLIAGLPTNDDLNVMKMLGSPEGNAMVEHQDLVLKKISETGFELGEEVKVYQFELHGLTKLLAVGIHGFVGYILVDGETLVLDFPQNEVQERTLKLFHQYIHITGAIKLKKSIIFEIEFNNQAKYESITDLFDYWILYDVENVKFDSKEKRISL